MVVGIKKGGTMCESPKYLKSKIPEFVARKTFTVKRRKNNLLAMSKAFTLVEILVAITILSVGILAVSQMTFMGMQVTRVINQKMYARAVMSRYYEILNNLPNSDLWVQNLDLDDGDLDVIDSTADFKDYYQMGGVGFRVCWNAINHVGNPVDDRIETLIRIHVLWNNDRNRIHTDLIKGNKF